MESQPLILYFILSILCVLNW